MNEQLSVPVSKAYTRPMLQQKLQQTFGYVHFRGEQFAIVQHILQGKTAIVIMPTGAGKSLCYQLPALMLPGTALVISPLIALMKNQIDQLRALGVSAYFLNSTLSRREINLIRKETEEGKVKLLYIAPESLAKEENIDFFRRFKVPFVAVDEVHCISEWGHDFRPEYRRIREVLDQIGEVPIVALTATATPKVQLDIQKNLRIEQAQVFKSSFNRPNLFYEVVAKKDARKRLLSFLRQKEGEAGIVYCLTRKKVEEISEMLQLNGINASPYHAGLDAKTRIQNQDVFLSEKASVIVATVAFGMGIDKADVRFVVHYDVPKSLESYYQETGRAGRDGKAAHCLMLYSYHDIKKIEKLNKSKTLHERYNIRALLEEVSAYAESPTCRRSQLLMYFGEQFTGRCEACDNCLRPTLEFEASEELGLILQTVEQAKTRNSLSEISEILANKKATRTHQQLPLEEDSDNNKAFWNSLLRQAIQQSFVSRSIESGNLFEILRITEKGKQFLASSQEIMLQYPHIYLKTRNEEIEEGLQREVLVSSSSANPDLLEQLMQLRQKIAEESNLPAYVIFQPISLEEMAGRYPTTIEEMLQIQGVGQGKMQKYGHPFLALVRDYVKANDIQTSESVLMKSAGQQSRTKISIIRQIDKKMRLEDIAESLGISFYKLLDEMEHICYSGTKLNLCYYINCMLEKDRQEEIHDYFLSSKSDNLSEACKSLPDYNEEEIRLMRIKFVSELAN